MVMKFKPASCFAATVLICALLSSKPAFAQLGEPANDLGVRLGHVHLTVKDVEAQRRFWTDAMGGTLVKNGPLTMLQFPGLFILLQEGASTAPPAGSVADHFRFVLKDINAARASLKRGNVKSTVGDNKPNQG